MLFPPAILIVMFVVGVLAQKSRPRLGRGLVIVGLVLLIVFTNPWLAGEFQRRLEYRTPISTADLNQAEAIVVLGGGRKRHAVEYQGDDQVGVYSLIRARYGAYLARWTELPLLVSGGSVRGESVSEAALMATLIEDELHVPVRWREERSRSTYENAQFSAELLKGEGIKRIALVSNAIHLPRAAEAFERMGMVVYPAPTDIASDADPNSTWSDYLLPSSGALSATTMGLHELFGRAWYRLRYY